MDSSPLSGDLPLWVEPAVILFVALGVLTLSSMSSQVFSALGIARARHLVDEGHKRLEPFVRAPDAYWMTVHILHVLSVVAVFWTGTVLLSRLPVRLESWLQWLILGGVYFVFYTALGLRFARGDERTLAVRAVNLLKPCVLVLRPLSYVLCLILKPTAHTREERFSDSERIEEELEVMLDESTRQGGLEDMKGRIMKSAIDYSETTVREVMIPRTELTAFSVDTPIDEALETCVREGYSRLPVYEGNLDTIVGILYFKDLVQKFFEMRNDDAGRAGVTVRSLVREAFFVPETNHIDAIFEDFKREHIHMAIVVDEFGGTAGLVTLEDIVEEVFGEIQDEYDSEENPIVPLDAAQDRVMVDARTNISEICELFDVDIEEDDDFESVGGLVISRLGRVGVVGDEVEEAGLKFVVREASEKCVLQVEVSRLPQAEGDGEN